MSNLKSGRMIAAIVGGLLAGACDKKAPSASSDAAAASAMSDALILCGGINACAGKSACKTEKNDCAGKNTCKGQGVVETTPAECKAKAGTIQPKLM